MTWTPILRGPQQTRALEIVSTIADGLRGRFSTSADVSADEAWSLATGRSGVALFFAHVGEALADDAARAFAARLVEESLDAATGVATLEHLFEGFTGVAWTLAHVDGWLLDMSDGDPNDTVDAALVDLVHTRPWQGEFDLVAGLAGLGVYALERLPRPAAVDLLLAVVTRLSELAAQDPHHPFWWTPAESLPAHIRQRAPVGGWNLGAAHGAPGVIALLAQADSVGVTTARPLLDRAIEWLLVQLLPAEVGSAFPTFAVPDVVGRRSRLAWCYGDPGVAATLFVAGRLAGARAWEAEAVRIAECAAARALADSGVVDASMCHGSAGLAHIFNRLYQASGRPVLRDAADAWLAQLVASYRPGVGLGGFIADAGDDQLGQRPGFLVGAAGIGLVLLAAATPLEPRWDRLYLLS